jgi:hypothetical protein
VGSDVRNTIMKISGQKPENLRLEKSILDVKKGLKQTHKGLQKIDTKPSPSTDTPKAISAPEPGQPAEKGNT